MFTSLLLTASLAGGQPPEAVYYPGGVIPSTKPTVPAPTPPVYRLGFPTPLTTLPDLAGTDEPGTPMPAPKAASPDGPAGSPETTEEVKEEKAEEPPPSKYLLEQTLAGTRLGNILSNRGITVYGWTQMSYNVSTASGSNAPVFMIDRANEFLLNQNYLVVAKSLDTSKKEFQWGWQTDWIVPGSDARTTLPRGLWNDQLTRNNGGPVLYPIDPYQFYAQAYLPNVGQGTTVKVGRFATHCSYELVQAVDTPFVSRAYMFQYNPFTHTGVWATTQLNDTWSVSYGAATGNDTFIDPANRFTFLGQIRWAPKDGKTSVLFNTSISDADYNAAEAFPFYNYYGLLVIHKFTDDLTYVLDSAYSHVNDVPNIGLANWYGAANYLIYAVNKKLSTTLRAEVFDDPQGFRTGSKGLYTEATWGFAWSPIRSLMIRPSVRYDFNGYSRPFEGDHSLWTGAIEAIVRW